MCPRKDILTWTWGYVILVLLYLRALAFDATTFAMCSKRRTWSQKGKLSWVVAAEGFFFVYGLLLLGLADNGPPHPFSNVRTFGGSNHYIAPTGLFHCFAEDIFGIVRVERTNSS